MTEEARTIVGKLRCAETELKEVGAAYFEEDDFGSAADLIESLSAQLDQVTRERDAAVEREWDLFDLLSSAWHGKQFYFKQEDGSVYSRESCQYLTFDQAIDEFAHSLTVAGDINVPATPKWISVKERLPPDLEEVLILVKETEFYGQYKELSKSYFCEYIGCVDDGEWFTVWCHGHRYIKDTAKEPCADKLEVTHWMPLPSPPKED